MYWEEVSVVAHETHISWIDVLHSLAYHEMATILAKVIYHFDMEAAMNLDDWTKQRVFVVWKKQPLIVKLTARRDV